MADCPSGCGQPYTANRGHLAANYAVTTEELKCVTHVAKAASVQSGLVPFLPEIHDGN